MALRDGRLYETLRDGRFVPVAPAGTVAGTDASKGRASLLVRPDGYAGNCATSPHRTRTTPRTPRARPRGARGAWRGRPANAGRPPRKTRDRYGYPAAPAAASAAWARSARSTPERDSEIRRRRAGLGSAEASHSSVFARVCASTWTAG
ncbi:hypothetical protein QFZ75_005039 [Streptomyces sp. V3I8]|nr:hypothetical protein [Streptomyces sp. V3I8]